MIYIYSFQQTTPPPIPTLTLKPTHQTIHQTTIYMISTLQKRYYSLLTAIPVRPLPCLWFGKFTRNSVGRSRPFLTALSRTVSGLPIHRCWQPGSRKFLPSYWKRSGIQLRAVTILSGMAQQNGKDSSRSSQESLTPQLWLYSRYRNCLDS